MSTTEEDKKLLNKMPEQSECLIHASKLRTKLKENYNKKVDYRRKIRSLTSNYIDYYTKQMLITGLTEDDIRRKVELLNAYYNTYKQLGLPDSAQDQLRPSILEEFMYFLFKDYVNELVNRHPQQAEVIRCGHVNAYSNIYFTGKSLDDFLTSPSPAVNVKEQDFSIYRKVAVEVEGQKIKTPKVGQSNAHEDYINVPCLVIENKSYVDKTMLDGIIAAAEKLKNGSPHSFFIVVAERYSVANTSDPAYSRIDQIYVLRKSKAKSTPNPIFPDVVIRLYHDAVSYIERQWFDIESSISKEGIILPDNK